MIHQVKQSLLDIATMWNNHSIESANAFALGREALAGLTPKDQDDAISPLLSDPLDASDEIKGQYLLLIYVASASLGLDILWEAVSLVLLDVTRKAAKQSIAAGEYEQSITWLGRALLYSRNSRQKEIEIATLNDIGVALLALGRKDDAQMVWLQALSAIETSGKREFENTVRYNLARVGH